MTREEVRRRLRKWARNAEEISALWEQYKAIVDEIDAAGDLHAQNLDGMPHAQTVGQPTEAAAIKRITLAERYADRLADLKARIDDLEDLAVDIDAALIFVSADEETVIRLKYKGHLDRDRKDAHPLTFAEIAARLHYTDRRIKQIEAAAVDQIGDWLEKNE